jgi:hypothetical protein
MTLIIENGTIVAGANSFATAAELATYAADYGLTVPDDSDELERLLRRAALQMAALSWKGSLVEYDQPLAWPRVGVTVGTSAGMVYGNRRREFEESGDVPSNVIPAAIKMGQMALAAEIHADDLVPAETKQGAVVSETVGPISVTYGAAQSWVTRPAAGKQSYANFGAYMNAQNQVRLSRG